MTNGSVPDSCVGARDKPSPRPGRAPASALPLARVMTPGLSPLTVEDGVPPHIVTVQKSIDSQQARGLARRRRSTDARRGPLMTQRRHGDFHQKAHAQKADCQLAAKGAADAAKEEVSLQDCSRSADRSRRPLSILVLNWHYAFGPPDFAPPSPEDCRRQIKGRVNRKAAAARPGHHYSACQLADDSLPGRTLC